MSVGVDESFGGYLDQKNKKDNYHGSYKVETPSLVGVHHSKHGTESELQLRHRK